MTTFQSDRHDTLAARFGLACLALAPDALIYEALLAGDAVPRSKLNADVLERIGEPRAGAPLAMSDEIARRVEVTRTTDETPFGQDVEIVTLDEFAAVEEAGAAAILGTADAALIPEGGDAMVYGDGGVGKTTLMIDLAVHLAAGDDWLGIPVERTFRVLLVEGRVLVFERPWGRFSFASADWRNLLASEVREREIDVVVVGPLTSSGMDAAGTLQEARDFIASVAQVRELSARPIAFVLVHHENKGGKVSGAWEGVGDTLLHVQQQGHARLRLFIQKARWASEQHATTLQLAWADTR